MNATLHSFGDFSATTACGIPASQRFCYATEGEAVTCKRCLASLAKRDRKFQGKARGWFGTRPAHHAGMIADRFRMAAARAIAREEGRAL